MSEQFAIRGLVAYKPVAFKEIVYKIKMIKPRFQKEKLVS